MCRCMVSTGPHFCAAQIKVLNFSLNSNHHTLLIMLYLSDYAVGGYSRTALCNPTGQICTGGADVPSWSFPPTVSERSSSALRLKPFCMPASPQSLASSVSMKEMLSGSRVTFSASVSGILQGKSRTKHLTASRIIKTVSL